MNSKLVVKPISTIREQFESKGGCFKCPLNYGRFEVLWISKPTFDGSNTILKSLDSKGYCVTLCEHATGGMINDRIITLDLTRHSCVIKEEYRQESDGSWKGSRHVLYGKYHGQEMICLENRKLIDMIINGGI